MIHHYSLLISRLLKFHDRDIHHFFIIIVYSIVLNLIIHHTKSSIRDHDIFSMIHHYSLLLVVYSNFMIRDIHHSFHCFFITIVYYSLLNLSKCHSLNVMDLP